MDVYYAFPSQAYGLVVKISQPTAGSGGSVLYCNEFQTPQGLRWLAYP